MSAVDIPHVTDFFALLHGGNDKQHTLVMEAHSWGIGIYYKATQYRVFTLRVRKTALLCSKARHVLAIPQPYREGYGIVALYFLDNSIRWTRKNKWRIGCNTGLSDRKVRDIIRAVEGFLKANFTKEDLA